MWNTCHVSHETQWWFSKTLKFTGLLHHHHQFLHHKGRWGITDDFATSLPCSIFPCSPLPSGTWRTPGLSVPRCCLPTSSSICLVFFLLSLCLARWFWSALMSRRHDHTTAVCVSLKWSGGLCMMQLPAGSWHGLPRWWHGLCHFKLVSALSRLLLSVLSWRASQACFRCVKSIKKKHMKV